MNNKIKFLRYDTYLAMIKNSISANTFRNIYFNTEGQKNDLTENGNLSCAIFVSSILFLLKLIGDVHVTVDGTIKDLVDFGWSETKELKPGCVLVWSEKNFGNGVLHKHIGFYIGDEKAISNNSELGYPTEHDWKKFDSRKVELILWNKLLT
jgi:hypothetical protein